MPRGEDKPTSEPDVSALWCTKCQQQAGIVCVMNHNVLWVSDEGSVPLQLRQQIPALCAMTELGSPELQALPPLLRCKAEQWLKLLERGKPLPCYPAKRVAPIHIITDSVTLTLDEEDKERGDDEN